jgi:hypothetical protein
VLARHRRTLRHHESGNEVHAANEPSAWVQGEHDQEETVTGVEFHQRIFKKDQDLLTTFSTKSGGLRGLLDPYCHEYKGTTMPEKLALLKQVSLHVQIEDMEQAFIDVMASAGYPEYASSRLYLEGITRLLDAALQSS